MKVIQVDNYDREIYSDKLVVPPGVLTEEDCKVVVKSLNENPKRGDSQYYRMVPDDYKLFVRDC